jgi:cytochrome c oxidase cbb3-type subunit III
MCTRIPPAIPLVLAVVAAACPPVLAQPRGPSPEQRAAIERGKVAFKSNCGFCHGEDATGNRAPDLIRSTVLNHDEHGEQLGPVIRNGRPDKGMPGFTTLSDQQVADIVAFLHSRAEESMHSAHVPGDYPIAKLLTGNAAAGKAYFEGSGQCVTCHSVTGDLAHVGSRYSPIDLQQRIVYPAGGAARTAKVTDKNGKVFEGRLAAIDEFFVAVTTGDGWYRRWPRAEVQVEIHDPLSAHRELTARYTDADMHNLFAYLSTLQ